jgi:hypothetical protein
MIDYKLPQGIQIPKRIDYPKGYDYNEINQKREQATIAEGYKITKVEGENFQYFTMINIDADRIWNLFIALANTLVKDHEAYGILGIKEEDPHLSNFTNCDHLIELFKEYRFELTNDGFLHFGIASEDSNILNEVYVSNYKYLQVWSEHIEDVISVLSQFCLKEHNDLRFIDEFPVISKALSPKKNPLIRHYMEVIEQLEKAFSMV